MAANVTSFVVVLPLTDDPVKYTAQQTFLSNMNSIGVALVSYQAEVTNPDGSQYQANMSQGFVTSTQATQALGFLNTLNAALGTNVICYTNPATTQP